MRHRRRWILSWSAAALQHWTSHAAWRALMVADDVQMGLNQSEPQQSLLRTASPPTWQLAGQQKSTKLGGRGAVASATSDSRLRVMHLTRQQALHWVCYPSQLCVRHAGLTGWPPAP